MRRLANIIVWTIGVMAMLIAPMIPHHHHGEVVCMIMERCELDDAINDEHTEHQSQQPGEGCTSCDKSSQWYDRKGHQTRISSGLYLLPLLTRLGYEWRVEDVDTSVIKRNVKRSTCYESARHGTTLGLRAPPLFAI